MFISTQVQAHEPSVLAARNLVLQEAKKDSRWKDGTPSEKGDALREVLDRLKEEHESPHVS